MLVRKLNPDFFVCSSLPPPFCMHGFHAHPNRHCSCVLEQKRQKIKSLLFWLLLASSTEKFIKLHVSKEVSTKKLEEKMSIIPTSKRNWCSWQGQFEKNRSKLYSLILSVTGFLKTKGIAMIRTKATFQINGSSIEAIRKQQDLFQ